MFGFRQVSRISLGISAPRQIQPRAVRLFASDSDGKPPSSQPEDPFQKRSLGRGQKIQNLKQEVAFLSDVSKDVYDHEAVKQARVQRDKEREQLAAERANNPSSQMFRGLKSIVTSQPASTEGTSSGAGRGKMEQIVAEPRPYRPRFPQQQQQQSQQPQQQQRQQASGANGSTGGPPRRPNRFDQAGPPRPGFPRPPQQFRSQQEGGSSRPPQQQGERVPGSYGRPQFGGPQGGPGSFRGRGGFAARGRGGSRFGGDRRGRAPRQGGTGERDAEGNAAYLFPNDMDDDAPFDVENYLDSKTVHPFNLSDYYSPIERAPYKLFQTREDNDYEYPSRDISKYFGGRERFSVGEVAHHAIDWDNFDRIPRLSNEKYFVNIESLEEARLARPFKTPKEFLQSVPANHSYYRDIKEVYTLLDRNPWFTDAEKINFLKGVHQHGPQMA